MKHIEHQGEALNLIIIGNGHYSTGQTALTGHKTTDKDFGVLLPSALYLRERGWIGRIAVCGQDGDKFSALREQLEPWRNDPGLNTDFDSYPNPGERAPQAYLRALDNMPQPCAALIAVPDAMHVEVMLACAERGIPFMIVKPAVTRLDDYYRVCSQLPADLLALVDYHKVYDEANLLILEDLRQGNYGRIHHVSSLMSQRRDMIEIYQRWLRSNPNCNINHYLGSHYIHMTGFLTQATPLDVRATQQFGFIQQQYQLPVADCIQTQVRWLAREGYEFVSYHNAGWADPSQTESMTYQEMHWLTERGHIFSDQRYRGTRKVLSETGLQAPNPYFFNFHRSLLGGWSMESKYGYQSIRNFVQLALATPQERQGLHLPTLAESEHVSAILEAADLSLQHDSAVIQIKRKGPRLQLS